MNADHIAKLILMRAGELCTIGWVQGAFQTAQPVFGGEWRYCYCAHGAMAKR